MRYYKIYVDNTRELYTYEDREDKYEVGDRVIISFRGKQRTGLIIAQDTNEEKNYRVLPYEQVITSAIPS